jgi:hypothetical protein
VNTRTLASVSASVAVVAGIVATILWRDLHAERELTAALQTRLAGSAGPVQAPLPPQGFGAQTAAVVPDNADAWDATVAPPPDAGGMQERPKALLDPVARLAELRSTIEAGYPGLAEALRLTEHEADQLFGLLAQARLALEAESVIFDSEPVDLVAAAQVSRNRQRRQTEHIVSLKSLLGDARYAQWQDYQQTQSVRLQARNYATALANAGVPLDSAQTNVIAMAMLEEQERRRRHTVELAQTGDPAQLQSQVLARQSLGRQQQESSQRVLEAASRHLTAQQLGLLRGQMELQDAVERDAARAHEHAREAPKH